MSSSNEAKHAQVNELRAELTSFRESASREEDFHAEAQGKTAQLEGTLTELQQQLLDVVAKGESAANEHAAMKDGLQSKLEAAGDKQAELESVLVQRTGQVAEVELKSAALEAALSEMSSSNEAKHAQVNELQAELTTFRESASREEDLHAEAQGKTAQLEGTLTELQQQLLDVVAKGESAANEHAAMKDGLQSKLEAAGD